LAGHADDSKMLKDFKTYYRLALFVSIVALLILETRHAALAMPLFSVVTLLCSIGLGLRYFAKARSLWEKLRDLAFVVLINKAIYFGCATFAQYKVSEALGMPAKDYDNTVHLLSAAMCIQVWCAVVAFILLLAAVGTACVMIWHGLKSHVQTSPLLSLFFLNNKNAEQVAAESFWGVMLSAGNFMGIFGFVFLVGLISGCFDWMWSPVTIKKLAYWVDYRPVANYPGVDPSKRVVFHDRGLISYAVPEGNDIHIEPYQLPAPH
jgi:hypothetical protein